MSSKTGMEVTIVANDGFPLAARVFGEGPLVVVIAGAMGVPQRFYRKFAQYLAENGLRVVTFDWRGIGESALAEDAQVSMGIWAEQDLDGVLRWARTTLQAERTAVVGHSMGGQLVPLCESASELSAAYFVGSQSGYWGHWSGLGRLKVMAAWHLLIPASTALLGKLPGRLLGGGEDVPAGAAAEWARFGRHPDYILSHRADTRERFARLTLPICFVRISDDQVAPWRAVKALASYYRGASVELRTLDPRALGCRSIGHFGFFRPEPGSRAWPHALEFLRTHLTRLSPFLTPDNTVPVAPGRVARRSTCHQHAFGLPPRQERR
ncbi:MAG TPA: alpha/beta fold hydrolase [Enhygromyxa sp.]|nr:alpha/beta fold hydrolase [Enhygromyxa sp.]